MIKTKVFTNEVVAWIKDYFKGNDEGKAVIGISGGKDSTIVAGLLCKALGADRVIAVMMPCGEQKDISDSIKVCDFFNIPSRNRFTANIEVSVIDVKNAIICGCEIGMMNEVADSLCSDVVNTNLPSRIRMCTLYTVAAIYPNSRVVNTSNSSERYIGYSTKFGDGVGDFSPLGNLTVREVLAIGDDLGIPYALVHKEPSDGMSGKSDEDKIGFTYNELDSYLLGDAEPTIETKEKIKRLHEINLHKTLPMPMFCPEEEE